MDCMVWYFFLFGILAHMYFIYKIILKYLEIRKNGVPL